MTRHEALQCVHEPFGDAYYFGPERLAERYENDPKARKESGYEDSTYRTIFDRIAKENSEVRLLIFYFYFAGCPPLFWIPSLVSTLLLPNQHQCSRVVSFGVECHLSLSSLFVARQSRLIPPISL